MAKFRFVEWLVLWLQETAGFRFDWDEGNRTKSVSKHAVTTIETEEVFLSGQAAPLGIQVSPEVPEQRLGIVGPTYLGRILHVVFTLRDGEIRPISARPAHKKEKELYEAYLREVSQ
ncbi:MAG: BrnT family toxin [Elusimicrobia bacterium]|nr:BrnT family toxin [Elusimicrobiota bacterium]